MIDFCVVNLTHNKEGGGDTSKTHNKLQHTRYAVELVIPRKARKAKSVVLSSRSLLRKYTALLRRSACEPRLGVTLISGLGPTASLTSL